MAKNTTFNNNQRAGSSQQDRSTMRIKEEPEPIEDVDLLLQYHFEIETVEQIKQEMDDAMDIKPTTDDLKLYQNGNIFNTVDATSYIEAVELKEEITVEEAKVESYSEFEKRRLNLETDGSTTRCTICHIKFEEASQLAKHIKDEHQCVKRYSKADPGGERSNANEVECPKCFRIFENSAALAKHESRRHQVKSFRCKECEMEFPNGGNLRYHRIQAHLIPPLSCPNCSQRFRNKHTFYNHVMSHQNQGRPKKLKCPECPQQFLRLKNLETHSRQHNRKKKSA